MAKRDGGGGLAVYVTSHGFGHLNRVLPVLRALPSSIPLVIGGTPDLFPHWRERLARPIELREFISDVGALHPAGDSQAIDPAETLRRAREVHQSAMRGLDAEARYLRERPIAAVLCDAPAVPLAAAREAGIFACFLGNFTWVDIYEPWVKPEDREARAFVEDLRQTYRQADRVFRAQPALRSDWFEPGRTTVQDVGLVVNPARSRRKELLTNLGLAPDVRLVSFYTGKYGQSGMAWGRMEALEARGIHFIGFPPAPERDVSNMHILSPKEWNGAEVAASVDAIVAKAGYGTVSQAMAARTPMIYPPRTGFAEHPVLDQALRSWGGSHPVSASAFETFDIEPELEAALAQRPAPSPFPSDGAEVVARALAEIVEGRR